MLLLMLYYSVLAILAQVTFPTDFGDNATLAAIVVAFVMPVVVDFINGQNISGPLKAVLTFGECLVASVLMVLAMNVFGANFTLDFPTVFRAFLIVFVGAITFHRFYYKPSGISDRVAASRG